jgi:hypothetical protein
LELYCRECRDYVYLQQFDDAVVVSTIAWPGLHAEAWDLSIMMLPYEGWEILSCHYFLMYAKA